MWWRTGCLGRWTGKGVQVLSGEQAVQVCGKDRIPWQRGSDGGQSARKVDRERVFRNVVEARVPR